MYGYIKGIIKDIESNYIIIDNHEKITVPVRTAIRSPC